MQEGYLGAGSRLVIKSVTEERIVVYSSWMKGRDIYFGKRPIISTYDLKGASPHQMARIDKELLDVT